MEQGDAIMSYEPMPTETTDNIETPRDDNVVYPCYFSDTDDVDDNIDAVTDTADAPAQEIKYGYTGNGEYITPYQTTVIYHENSIFELAVATLADKAQLVPLGDNVDLDAVVSTCEHPSPEVLVFGTGFSRSQLEGFFDRGFQFIHLFARDVESAKHKYYDDDAPFDPRVVVFGVDTLHEHVMLIGGASSIYALEHVICASFPTYKSTLNEDINANGKYFLLGLEEHRIGEKLFQIGSSFSGMNTVDAVVTKGKAIHNVRETLANQRILGAAFAKISVGGETKSAMYLDPSGVKNELLNLIPAHPRCKSVDVVVFHSYEPRVLDDVTTWGARIVFVSLSGLNALESLREYTSEPVGTHGIASAWLSMSLLFKLLNF